MCRPNFFFLLIEILSISQLVSFLSVIFGSVSFYYNTLYCAACWCCWIWLPAQLFDSGSSVLFRARSNEKCWARESQRLIIFLLLEFTRCIWGQLPPVCAATFLSAQCELSQLEEECMPGRLLPPHQACPLPLLSLRLSFRVIHTRRASSSCRFFFCLFSLTPSHCLSSSDADLLLTLPSTHVCTHMNTCEIHYLILLLHDICP